MAPLTPHWAQPSHPDVQDVIINAHEFTSKSLSKISLPPFGLFAKMDFPPCTLASEPTYATVQCGRDKHLNLNSDLLYINHSCEPSLIFDTATQNIVAGPNGLRVGEELTFFYPSTEWHMAQPFDCLCGKPTCRGRISGAKDMTRAQLEGVWLNGHIHELLREQELGGKEPEPENGSSTTKADAPSSTAAEDATAQALRDALKHAEKVVEAARIALTSYLDSATVKGKIGGGNANGFGVANDVLAAGLTRRGVTSRELSGEMGGDTIVATGS
ncbi:uncharacterized protein F4807DRAFT_423548 [Annulohypoxylon truncatum]|uniref:uncharacterized protein n=1 Tax=Annulohypoxylon truncatum TaxID=327061 RepID=UPI002008AF07|nr:uncharacterized protein F4807DRAFT_423548 [Annulohypoxylon truncatum]KAI1210476.1 hypothetical protein F4807DRAFT_423548 [Annulohypoxylon truncatum]